VAEPARAERVVALDYLRGCVVVLVVLHHSVLAYCRFGHFDTRHYLWSTAPIVDDAKWLGFDVLVLFNDSFFMPLMFLLSGLFVWSGLNRKGAGGYARDRLLRLGLPFAVAVLTVIPLAYYPSFRMTGATSGFFVFWSEVILSGPWPSGPAWFIGVLLGFDLLAAAVHASGWRLGVLFAASDLFQPAGTSSLGHDASRPSSSGSTRGSARAGSVLANETRRPRRAILASKPRMTVVSSVPQRIGRLVSSRFGPLLAMSAIAYLPLLLLFGPSYWFSIGPFAVQASRIGLYGVYFLAGTIAGAQGLSIATPSWARWPALAAALFVCCVGVQVARLSRWVVLPPAVWLLLYGIGLLPFCAAANFAWLAVFARFARRRAAWGQSLAANAYGIYLVHYAAVTWLQYALLPVQAGAIVKAALVFVLALFGSWGLTVALRQIPAVARII
jgi:surface polysaccharide O-acyltransferase-like enzyme